MPGMLDGASKVCNFPRRDRGQKLNRMSIALTTISSIVAATRLGHQASKYGTGFLWDDGLIVVTLGIVIASTVVYTRGAIPNGLGRDVWLVTWPQLIEFVHMFALIEILYFCAIALLKTSILLFFYRIFSLSSISRLIFWTLIANGLYGIIFFFIGIFQCNPIIFHFTSLDGNQCLDVNAIVWSHAAISIVTDVWMLALPVWQIRSLQMHWKRKLAIGLMFGTGTL
jgi:hypothetical protein